MRIFALELNNDIKGLPERKAYIESLIARLPFPDLVLLPELALSSYMPNQNVWKYADNCGKETSTWALKIAEKYNTYVGVGYVDFENGNYYNRYLLADKKQVYGVITKSEAEAAVFKRGWFDSMIKTPFGKVAIAICYDSRRKHFYENIKDEALSLIVFPHGSPASSKKSNKERAANDFLCNMYLEAFKVPVVYVNSIGKLEYMPGIMGRLMKLSSFTMNGYTKIYAVGGQVILHDLKEVVGYNVELSTHKRKKDIVFYGDDLLKENTFFRHVILRPDIMMGIRKYNRDLKRKNTF